MAQDLVLVVDDFEDNRIVLQAILEYAGFRVLAAVNGQEAVRQSRAYMPVLVVMDLQMPRMNGWEATRILKCDPSTSHIPVLAYSADHRPSLDSLKQCGFCAYLRKPCGLVRVIAAVRLCLAGSAVGRSWIDLSLADLSAPLR